MSEESLLLLFSLKDVQVFFKKVMADVTTQIRSEKFTF